VKRVVSGVCETLWIRADMQTVRHSGSSEPYLCTPDRKASPAYLFLYSLSHGEVKDPYRYSLQGLEEKG